MSGWTWCIIGLALAFVELFAPSGFYLLLLGVSGVVVGLITLTGLFLNCSTSGVFRFLRQASADVERASTYDR
jgi:membrane protein implicated in regulation of membrane protease activity